MTASEMTGLLCDSKDHGLALHLGNQLLSCVNKRLELRSLGLKLLHMPDATHHAGKLLQQEG